MATAELLYKYFDSSCRMALTQWREWRTLGLPITSGIVQAEDESGEETYSKKNLLSHGRTVNSGSNGAASSGVIGTNSSIHDFSMHTTIV